MANLIASVPPGLTFPALVGGTMPDTPPRHSAPVQRAHDSPSDQLPRDERMRVYLPDGTVRRMTLMEYQEFLVSDLITPTRRAVEVTDRDDGGTGKIKAARKPGPDALVLDRETQDHIGQQLRTMYEQLLEEPVPGHLLMLMARLERQNRTQSNEC